MKTICITGASSGIGWATAKRLAGQHRLVLCGRREERLRELQQALGATQTHLLTFDVQNKTEVFSAFEALPDDWKSIDVLINNAGNAHGLAPIDSAELSDFDTMLQTNVNGVLYVTRAALPLLKRSMAGHIVNISSIAGKEAYANGNVYCASKAAVESLSQSMRIDLAPYGIKVTNIAPGAVETEFSVVRFKGDQDKADRVYQGFQPLVADDIAEAIAFSVEQPDHVQIADMTIFPKAQYNATGIVRS